jgi:hypothetical protein
MSIRQFRHHRCARKHRSYRTLLACMFPKVGPVVHGEGRFVVLAHCGTLTARRYTTSEEALADPNMNGEDCGSHCFHIHEVVELITPSMALPWPT